MTTAAPHRPKVAVIHEWLVNCAGSEKVLEQILHLYPDADLYSVVDFLRPEERGFIRGKSARTSFIQRLPGARKRFRHYLMLMPLAMEQLDLSGYELVISSNHAVAKGVITGPDQLHVCYIHSPMRYAWDLQHQYLRESGLVTGLKSWITRAMLHYLRQWDMQSANRVDAFVANSAFIARRVAKAYRREAEVVHPPVDVARFALREQKEDFYLAASRLAPYKHMPMIVRAFAAMPQRKLVVIGDGPDMAKVRAEAGPNVTVLGYQDDAALVNYMQRARALVFAAEEDFGITPVEAQACGTPVIAFGRGGSLETVRGLGVADAPTGLWFSEQTVASITDAVQRFEAAGDAFSPQACRAHAEQFAPEQFRAALADCIHRAWARFNEGRLMPMALPGAAGPAPVPGPQAAGPGAAQGKVLQSSAAPLTTGAGLKVQAGASALPSSVLPAQ